MGLGDDARSALEAYRERITPDPPVFTSNWATLKTRLERGEDPSPDPTGDFHSRASQSTTRRVTFVAAAVAVAAAIVAVGASGLVLSSRGDADTMQSAVYGAGDASAEQRAEAREAEPRTAGETRVEANKRPSEAGSDQRAAQAMSTPSTTDHAKPTRRTRAKPKPTSEPTEPLASLLREEAAMLGRAQAAMRDGDPRGALVLLNQHATSFPHGRLVDERRVLEARALCDSGRIEEARGRVATFLAERPDSSLAARMKAICAATR